MRIFDARDLFRRMYCEGLRQGQRINSVTIGAEWLWLRLHAACDDFGNFPADPHVILALAAPRRLAQGDATAGEVDLWLAELVNATNDAGEGALVELYEVRGELYGHLWNFTEMQPGARNGSRTKRYPGIEEGERVHPGETGFGRVEPNRGDLDFQAENEVVNPGASGCGLRSKADPVRPQNQNQQQNQNQGSEDPEGSTSPVSDDGAGRCSREDDPDESSSGHSAAAAPPDPLADLLADLPDTINWHTVEQILRHKFGLSESGIQEAAELTGCDPVLAWPSIQRTRDANPDKPAAFFRSILRDSVQTERAKERDERVQIRAAKFNAQQRARDLVEQAIAELSDDEVRGLTIQAIENEPDEQKRAALTQGAQLPGSQIGNRDNETTIKLVHKELVRLGRMEPIEQPKEATA